MPTLRRRLATALRDLATWLAPEVITLPAPPRLAGGGWTAPPPAATLGRPVWEQLPGPAPLPLLTAGGEAPAPPAPRRASLLASLRRGALAAVSAPGDGARDRPTESVLAVGPRTG